MKMLFKPMLKHKHQKQDTDARTRAERSKMVSLQFGFINGMEVRSFIVTIFKIYPRTDCFNNAMNSLSQYG